METKEIFTIKNLCFSYPEREEKALDNISFSLARGEFLVLAGPSGCGKSTLLRQLKSALRPHGRREGKVCFLGSPLEQVELREQSGKIGFVQQSPENQLVTDKVWHELAFGLESLGCKTVEIRARVAEMASFFGIQDWFYQETASLSGGQKQLLNLAAVMVLRPEVLILDEPTSQLDPIAATEFLAALGRISRELGTAVLLTEHRLEEALPMCDRVLILEKGRLVAQGRPREVGAALLEKGDGMFLAMPAAMRVWAAADGQGRSPVTVREGRAWLEEFSARRTLKPLPPPQAQPSQGPSPALELENLYFRYEKVGEDVLRDFSLELYPGELLTLLGGNGAGKSTALSLAAGLKRPYRGKVRLFGQTPERGGDALALLPQDPQRLFVEKNLRLDLEEGLEGLDLSKSERTARILEVIRLCRLETLLDRHPYDLSGGEQQRAALAKILLRRPRVLLLDEPTKGLDAEFKQEFAAILRALQNRGTALLLVSHDVEFCARYAGRCALLFGGAVVSQGTPREFFSGNSFYTTAACRMGRQVVPGAVTAEELIAVCGGVVPPETRPPEVPPGDGMAPVSSVSASTGMEQERMSLWRKILALFGAALLLAVMGKQLGWYRFPDLFGTWKYGIYGEILLPAFLILLAVGKRGKLPPGVYLEKAERKRLQKRSVVAAILIMLCIPFTLWAGLHFWTGKKFLFIALLVLLECMLPFFLVFEGRKPQARELVLIAVLCALGVAGRAALFMLPEFKPVLALVILSGVALGGETGFLVGAVTMLVSNMLLSQGPWTPWQMFAMGSIGLLAGLLFRKGLLRRDRLSLCIFGFLTALVVYGGIMDPAAALIAGVKLSPAVLLSYYATGLPMNLIHGMATVFFLWICAEPMLEKLDRIKVKYGLIS